MENENTINNNVQPIQNGAINDNIIMDKKPTKKEKIIVFIIGVLVGAVVATGAFFAYVKIAGVGSNSSESSSQMPSGTPPDMPSDGQSGESGQGGTPPEKPSDDNSQSNTGRKGQKS